MKFNIDHDYHIHSKLSECSSDEEQTTERMLQYAKENHFREICITDHFWDENVPGAFPWYRPQNYEHIAQSLPLPKSDDVTFYFGCEAELDKNMTLAISEKMMDNFDFIIIPTTHLHMMGDTIDAEATSVEARAEIYVERLDKLLDMALPFHKIGIAHLTCPLIAYHSATDFDEHIRIIDSIPTDTFKELFSKLAKKGAGFELNFDIGKYSEEQLPRILRPYKIAKEMGCKFYLGSDAHHPFELDRAKGNFEKIVSALDLEESDQYFFHK